MVPQLSDNFSNRNCQVGGRDQVLREILCHLVYTMVLMMMLQCFHESLQVSLFLSSVQLFWFCWWLSSLRTSGVKCEVSDLLFQSIWSHWMIWAYCPSASLWQMPIRTGVILRSNPMTLWFPDNTWTVPWGSNGHRYVLLCRALCGNMHYTEESAFDGLIPDDKHSLMAYPNRDAPREFIVFQQSHVYPEYIIEFE